MVKPKKGKMVWMILSVLIITFLIVPIYFLSKNLLTMQTYELTPEGEELMNEKQIEKDVAFLFREKYKIYYKVGTFRIRNILHLNFEPKRTILKRAIQNENDKVIEISLTDKRVRGTDINVHKEGKVLVTSQAIKFLIYFIHRDYDKSIKAVKVLYTPKNFDIDANTAASIVIIIEDFNKEYGRLIDEGFEGQELERKLEEKFINHD
jgi:hypothetical protein